MNPFWSEEHGRNWSGFKEGTGEGSVTLSALVNAFSGNSFAWELGPDTVSNYRKYTGEFISVMGEVGEARPFWSPEGP